MHSARGLAAILHFVGVASVALLLAVVVAGCNLGVRTFGLAFARGDGGREVLVVVNDHSGSVVSVDTTTLDQPPPIPRGMRTLQGLPKSLVIFWTGEACESRVTIEVTETSGNLEFVVASTQDQVDCNRGPTQRAVLIGLSLPADSSRIGLRFEP